MPVATVLIATAWWTAARLRADPARVAVADSTSAASAERRDGEIAFYERRVAEDPESALDLAQLAGIHLQRGRELGQYSDIVRAETAARRSLAIRTNHNGKTYLTLAASLLAQHRFVEARDAARSAVDYNPDVPAYGAMLGEIQLELGDYDAARATFRSLAGSRTSPSVAGRLARWAEIEGRTGDVRSILNASLRDLESRTDVPREQVAWFYLRRGDVELREGDLGAAENAYRAGLHVWPADYRVLAAMARLESLRGRPDRAIEYGERAIAISLDPATLGLVGDAYAARGDSAQSEEYYRTMEIAVLRQPGAFHRAWGLFLLDHDRRVSEVLANASAEIATRRDVYGYDLLAWAFHKSGRDRDALQASTLALRMGTRDAMLLYHAAAIEHALGDDSAARRDLRRALEINPHFHPTQARAARTLLDSLDRAVRRMPGS